MGVNAFVEAHAALILRFARQAARPPLDPEDVAQEVAALLLRWEQQGSFDPARVENPEAYLRVVVRNAAAREARRKRAEPLLGESDGAEASEQPAYAPVFTEQALEARALLERLKARLRPREALVFALIVEDGLNLDQVAEALGTNRNNVYQIRHRIRNAARELFDAVSSPEHSSQEAS